ncbi:MAG: transcriptional regulator [Muribaculaceae bacterium]|nr:transcriptional regulator [Muribaculaceae bacterium]
MNRLVHFLILLLCLPAIGSAAFNEAPGHYLSMLDSLIDKKDDFQKAKVARIAYFQNKAHNAATEHDKYIAYSQLFDEYSTFNADSALKYINLNIGIADKSGNPEWKATTRIEKSNLLAGTGLLKEAENEMLAINRNEMPADLLPSYYGQMIFLYSHLGNYAGGDKNEYYVKERAYKDSIMDVIPTTHKDYLWYKGWDILGTDKTDSSLIPSLLEKVEASQLNSRDDAKDFYMLAKLYEWQGDKENYKKYMALSAICDVKTANAEIASLEELAKIMFDNGKGNIDRAYDYINYSLNKALTFPNRVRAFGIARTQDAINLAYQQRARIQEKRIRLFLVLVAALALLSLFTVAVIIMQNRKLKKQRENLDSANKELNNHIQQLSDAQRQLADANSRLTELNSDLHKKNEELNEANYVKEEYIGYLFTICSNYIGKLEDFRKSIHVKAITRKYKEIEAATETHDSMKKELKEFYKSFDTVFLHIYPNFINDFNALLQPDKQIVPKEEELLNTELRIYALVRLGITDSVKIAEFLHCSPQTVYNNRFRVRNKAIIPREDFAETVRTLGKFMERPS